MSKHKHVPKTAIPINSQKQPVVRAVFSREKRPVTAVSVSKSEYDDHKASWRIGKIQLAEPYGWRSLGVDEIVKIKSKLADLERCTWKEIFVRDARNNHKVICHELKCPHARKWMENNMPDQPYLWTIRVTAKERIWGIFSEGAYHIIFWDPDHLIWEVQKKNT